MSKRNHINVPIMVDIIVEPDEDGFHAFCHALKGLHVGGDTEAQAIENARDAAVLHVESLIKHHGAKK